MDADQFRANFPEFVDIAAYPNSVLNYWLGIGARLLRIEAWDDLLDHGLELFAAHHIVLSKQAQKAIATGAAPGVTSGVVASKSVDRVSVSYDTSSATIAGQGHWNLTIYGVQFIQLSQMVGMGGVQAFGGGDAYGMALAQWQDGTPRWP